MIDSLDIACLKSGYAAEKFRPSDVVTEIYGRIDSADSAIWISKVSFEDALEVATRLEASGVTSHQPLWGIPFAIKDNIDAAGMVTTAGCPDYAYAAEEAAHVVQLLLDAGAVLIGKTNLDQFATGLVGTRTPYGIPGNPVAPGCVPGGSSCGSAVAVASGLVSFSLGTDTAGSGRIPAAFNRLVGLKPTRGWFSNRGIVPACRSLDCVSIFGLTVSDTTEVSAVMGNYDSADAFARESNFKQHPPGAPVFAVPKEEQLEFFGDAESEQAFRDALENMRGLGWQEKRIDFSPFSDAAKLLYEGPWVAERYAAIREFIEQSPDSLQPVTRGIIEKAREATAVDCFEAGYQLAELKRKADQLWEDTDILVTPTAGTIFTVEQVEADPVRLNTALGYYTNFMNLLDLCAMAVPAGSTSAGLPFGITIAAPAFADKAVALFADQFDRSNERQLGATTVSLSATPPLPLEQVSHQDCKVAVCGAHLQGLPLNHQLVDHGAILLEKTTTSPAYRLYALPNTTPQKPGMLRDSNGKGASIEIEIYSLSAEAFGKFVHAIPSPLGIGKIETASGEMVSGFLCEPEAITEDAHEVTAFGGWRAYVQSKS